MIKIMLCFTLEHCLENNGQDPKLKKTPSLDAREGGLFMGSSFSCWMEGELVGTFYSSPFFCFST